jgi:hypothetical protein
MAIVDSQDVYERAWKKLKADASPTKADTMHVILGQAFEEQIEAEQPKKAAK